MNRKLLIYCLMCLMLFTISLLWGKEEIFAAGKPVGKPVVIVIDPGHGGANEGAIHEDYIEKEMNMAVANAMKNELEKYEDVIVYLTHESTDEDMSLKQRAQFANDKNADFLYSLHFNYSLSNQLFGAEVWVSAFGSYYADGYSFAEISMDRFSDIGIYSRGIKTRLGDSGNDYYGIIRECKELNIKSALIEHCHIDHKRDQEFIRSGEADYVKLGILDATAVAQYFGLHSEQLGVDYSDYPVSDIAATDQVAVPDSSAPDNCDMQVTDFNQETREIELAVTAHDAETDIIYYAYSLNGGNVYTELFPFPRDEGKVTFTVTLPANEEVELRAIVYNIYDLRTESNIIQLEVTDDKSASAAEADEAEIITDEITESEPESIAEITPDGVEAYQSIIIFFLGLLILYIIVLSIVFFFRKKKRSEKD